MLVFDNKFEKLLYQNCFFTIFKYTNCHFIQVDGKVYNCDLLIFWIISRKHFLARLQLSIVMIERSGIVNNTHHLLIPTTRHKL